MAPHAPHYGHQPCRVQLMHTHFRCLNRNRSQSQPRRHQHRPAPPSPVFDVTHVAARSAAGQWCARRYGEFCALSDALQHTDNWDPDKRDLGRWLVVQAPAV